MNTTTVGPGTPEQAISASPRNSIAFICFACASHLFMPLRDYATVVAARNKKLMCLMSEDREA
jgi:hypothetical protein